MNRRVIALVGAVMAVTGSVAGIARGEPHAHHNYPPVPSGQSGLVQVFGQPCSRSASTNSMTFVANDDKKTYRIRYHAKLGGTTSTNMPDIRGHIVSQGYTGNLLSGIWGYTCRLKRGSKSQYSVHSWGAAVDINSAYEHVGHAHSHTVPAGLGKIWRDHRWVWGLDWRDAMHFQYARDY